MKDMTESPEWNFATHLAKRVAGVRTDFKAVQFQDVPIPDGLSHYLAEHLAAGETHYTTRPGIPELRTAIGRELHECGGHLRESDGVIVTHGEGEALYVTLLGLGLDAHSSVVVQGACRHRQLFGLIGIELIPPNGHKACNAYTLYREFREEPTEAGGDTTPCEHEIVALGGLLFSDRSAGTSLSALTTDAVVIGHLDSLPALDSFRIGFVAGPPETVKRIQTWKQALSICTAAPSQRAALFAVGLGGVS